MRFTINRPERLRRYATSRRLLAQARATRRFQPGRVRVDGLVVNHFDLLSLAMEYKDIFLNGIYHFESDNPRPRILDGGSYIGMSGMYFKTVYPDAEITCFEPDPGVAGVLRQNLEANGMADVTVVEAGLGAAAGTAGFAFDGADGGQVVAESERQIELVALSEYLDEEVDFLKLNIEGLELPVLEEVGERLRNVHELVVEYHGWPDRAQAMGPILSLLDGLGFRYLVNHFDYLTNGAVRPPFHLSRDATWFALIYARRADLIDQ